MRAMTNRLPQTEDTEGYTSVCGVISSPPWVVARDGKGGGGEGKRGLQNEIKPSK